MNEYDRLIELNNKVLKMGRENEYARAIGIWAKDFDVKMDYEAIRSLALRLTSTNLNVYPHENLVKIAMNSGAVVAAMVNGKKIEAIKELRSLTNCGLREAKDAVESPELLAYVGPPF